MSQLTKEGIEGLIDKWKNTYILNPATMLSGYRQEKQTVADYEGRQILELMQNADDAGSDSIHIEINTSDNTITISNNGNGFSIEGVESLMYTGLSTKNKVEYIGNKGLGFRAILNWVEEVNILTKEVSFAFSKAYSEKFYTENLLYTEFVQSQIAIEIKEKRLVENEIPIAALAFPKIIEGENTRFVTSIVLKLRVGELKKAENQLQKITEETLLFLPHIKTIVIEKDDEELHRLIKNKDEEAEIIINDTHWQIYRSQDCEYEKVKFRYAIAWKEDWNLKGRFFNYFTTDVATNLPCIIHATFDLTNNRKEFNENEANKHILQEIVKSLGEIAEKNLKKETSDWAAYEFLHPSSLDNRAILTEFYHSISKIREEQGLYPTVDNQYLTKNEVVSHGAEFSNWIVENGFGEYFPAVLKSAEHTNIIISKRYTAADLLHYVSKINESINLVQRVMLIGILAKNEHHYFDELHDSKIVLPLLLNKSGEIISSDIRVFTKDTEGEDLVFPDFINDIEFISIELYTLIRDSFREEIRKHKLETESGESRAVKRFLDAVVNIGLDDITGVIQQIVSETNKEIKINSQPEEVVKQMVTSLFSIFQSNPDRRGNLTTIERIPLLTRSGKIKNSDELYFGKDYSVGIAVELIFEGIRTDDDYLAEPVFYDLCVEDEVIIKYFEWLNVNVFAKYENLSKSLGRWEEDEYTNFILSQYPDQRKDSYKTYNVKEIKDFECTLKNKYFSFEKLIAWISKDERLLQQLKSTSSDEIYFEFGRDRREISNKISYLLFLIIKSGITENLIASLPFNEINALKTINTSDNIFSVLSIADYKIEEVLDLLQIKRSFNELKPAEIYNIIKVHSPGFENNSQPFYKLLYEYFRTNEKTQLENYNPDFSNIYYFSRKGGVGKDYQFIPIDEVYYSDNKLLPQQILNNYWFINLPKRIGENRVAQFFGVKLIKDIINEIVFDVKENHPSQEELLKYINILKPFWLSYRLESLTKESEKREAARSIKDLKIQLVKRASYQTKGDEKFDFNDFDFIPNDNKVVLKYSGHANIELLKSKPEFCDVIAEIVCVVFKVADLKNTYRRIFKDGTRESAHILKADEKEYLLDEAKNLLGISQEELNFWKKASSGVILEADNEEEFKESIETTIGDHLPEYYNKVDFHNWSNPDSFKFLKWLRNKKNISIDGIVLPKDVKDWHLRQIYNNIKNAEAEFERLLWCKTNESGNKLQKQKFYDKLASFEKNSEDLYEKLELNKILNLAPDYGEALRNYVNEKFEIDLNLNQKVERSIEIKPEYSKIIASFTFGDSVDDMTKIIKDNEKTTYSLMFFEGFEADVRSICEKLKKEVNHDFENELEGDEEDVLDIIDCTISPGSFWSPAPSGNRNNGGSYTSKGARQKAASGKKQENRVKKALEKKGYVVNHVSIKADAYHYDIEYRKENETDWRFLEVKKDSGGYFFLTREEKETALLNINKDRYDVAVVNDTGIHIIRAPFLFEDENFENNSKFKAEPTEYRVSFKLNKEQEC